eukprot:CAMPEP_0170369344 /NCGR_PEP_ID=MMETSP0117_2-20130122/7933_1 /TAXON_ID=400756 /ORGANISM="Durinskia baltica, Strain CSIRO CS-38" /LENGTH=594 /DNA_ID=CAMNT_0010624057 /DNA_START=70 /DNA_END=1854 /DNA_ORIENTATION=-
MFRKVVLNAGIRRNLYATTVRTYKHTAGTFAIAGSISITAVLYGQEFNTSCEQQIELPYISLPVVEVVDISKMQEIQKESIIGAFIRSAKKATCEVAKTTVKAARYAQRLLLYALYGLPMTVLLPTSYVVGSSVPAVEEFTWDYIIWSIQHLGPCFVKLAQWASTRPDLFPPRLVGRLVKLQDDVAVTHPRDTIEKTLTAAFGSTWKDLIDLDPNPLGAGSVAQVFKGRLKKEMKSAIDSGVDMLGRKKAMIAEIFPAGKEVAIKMIHPHVEALVRTDMELLDIFAWAIDHIPSLEILSLGETCRQFAETMNKQLDLRVEAHNLITFSEKFAQDKWASFPSPIDTLISKNVMVETLFSGTPINHYMNLKAEEGSEVHALKMKLSDLGCRLILKMVFFDNFVHGDLHPGNIMVEIQPNGEPRLQVLDCGIVYAVKSEEEYRNLVEICLAFMKHDGLTAGRRMIANNSHASVKDADAFCQGVQKLVEDCEQHSYFEHLGEYVGRVCELSRLHHVRMDPSYFKIAMALKVAEGISLAFNKDLDLVSKCIPIIVKAQALRAMGVTNFPKPEDDPNRAKDSRQVAGQSNSSSDSSSNRR